MLGMAGIKNCWHAVQAVWRKRQALGAEEGKEENIPVFSPILASLRIYNT